MGDHLTEVEKRALLRELVARSTRAAQAGLALQPTESEREAADKLKASLFGVQRSFFFPEPNADGKINKRRAACCTRRAGKTTGDAAKLLYTGTMNPRATSLYVGQTSITARDTIWTIIKEMASDFDVPFKPHETTLTMQHRRSSGQILLKGADTVREIEKRRGLKLILAILDESGAFGEQIEDLVVSVIGPGLRDLDGELLLNGTPGYYPAGLFYEVQAGLRKNWDIHRWSLLDNPFLSDVAKDLDAICAEEGLTRDDPRFIREYLGLYALNTKTQMFAYDPVINSFTDDMPAIESLNWFLGVDFGWNDETAIVPVGWRRSERRVWVPESWSAIEQVADDVAAQLMMFIKKYKPKRIIGDTGGYGKGVAEQIWRDYRIFIEQAQKREKLNHVEFLNSAFVRGDVMVHRHCQLAKELPLVLWNEKKTDAHAKAKDNNAMALLYAWRQIAYLTSQSGQKQKEDRNEAYVGALDSEKLAGIRAEQSAVEQLWYLNGY